MTAAKLVEMGVPANLAEYIAAQFEALADRVTVLETPAG